MTGELAVAVGFIVAVILFVAVSFAVSVYVPRWRRDLVRPLLPPPPRRVRRAAGRSRPLRRPSM